MPRSPRRSSSSEKSVDAFAHDEARRVNNPTAELASLYEQQEEQLGAHPVKMTLPRARPLAEGERRLRDGDLDPQLVWNGATIRITPSQMDQLAATGKLELGDAQLVWRGKDVADWSDLVVNAPPIYIQEKVKPKAIIEALKRRTKQDRQEVSSVPDLFADFNGLDDPEDATDFYQHSKHWTNRMILGDSLQVMASLAQREELAGKVQCIYFDPPYGIKFNSNWQVSTLSRDVKDGRPEEITREPEQVKAFRDTWKDGIHSYLTYLRDRLTVARELLTDSGSIFVQIGDENVHRVRAMMDEVFGEENFVCAISAQKTGSQSGNFLQSTSDDILWFAKDKAVAEGKFRPLFLSRDGEYSGQEILERDDHGAYPLTSDGVRSTSTCTYVHEGKSYHPGRLSHWKVVPKGLERLSRSHRILAQKTQIRLKYYFDDYPVRRLGDYWNDVGGATNKTYVVQSSPRLIERCILMTTDPGDLVLDPTMGSGTTATVAEQWGRRWITIDTSRVAMALARTRLMSARYPYYLLADSPEGQAKEGEITRKPPKTAVTQGDIRQGFVYERAPHITLKSIANNEEIDEIWERFQADLEPLRQKLNAALGYTGTRQSASERGEDGPLEEWEIPRHPEDAWGEMEKDHATAIDAAQPQKKRDAAFARMKQRWGADFEYATIDDLPPRPADPWDLDEYAEAIDLLVRWWDKRIARQQEIDASIAARAEVESLYDRPHVDTSRVRVAGPFTVESLRRTGW